MNTREKMGILEELKSCLMSEPAEFQLFIGGLLASLPGGETSSFEPVFNEGLCWLEASLIADLLGSIEDSRDVKRAIRYLFGED